MVTKMFIDQIGDTMEVYIDDMVVKSRRVKSMYRIWSKFLKY